MTPEISRRCASCGASVRAEAAFCPQCGKPLGEAKLGNDALIDASETPARRRSGGRINTNAAPQDGERHSGTVSERDAASTDMANRKRVRAGAVTERLAEVGARVRQNRVAVAARDAVEENLRPRVEKIRQVSNVVFDEAADDPSLRFVLIAVALFLIFLAILLFSNLLR